MRDNITFKMTFLTLLKFVDDNFTYGIVLLHMLIFLILSLNSNK